MNLTERPTPITDAAKRPITANWNNEGDERRDVVFADFARTLERSLAERTEERGKSYKFNQALADAMTIDRQSIVALNDENERLKRQLDTTLAKLAAVTAERDKTKAWLETETMNRDEFEVIKAERDALAAKLAKCREALELFDLGVGFGVTAEMYDKRKQTLEETK